ncbi:MAG: CDP-diacylglycerol--serine O-phosphatidyltransferase [Deltaproteobacteria bacterium]|nr:CDP-diacylglycerol--serine O-phosphatidyltransferase [Deltaproteobacteria bacterium]
MDLKKTLFIFPNLLTSASLLCGVLAILRCAGPTASEQDIYRATLLVVLAFFFDLFDGRVARMTRTQSAFGVQYDSLADLVSFGLAPAIITYKWTLQETGIPGLVVCFVYVMGGALRLARFNVLSTAAKGPGAKPDKYMLGLPIPMAAGFIVALVVATRAMGGWPWLTEYGITVKGISYPVMAVVMVALALLMVSSVRFRSFKDVKLNAFTVAVLAFVVGSSVFLWWRYTPAYILIWLLVSYVTLGFGEAIVYWPRRRRDQKGAKPPAAQ